MNAILHIDDTTESHEDAYLVADNQIQERNNNLNLSSTSGTSTTSSMTSAESTSSTSDKQHEQELHVSKNDIIDNLAYNLFNKLKLNNSSSVSASLIPTIVLPTNTSSKRSESLNINEPPAIPPSTPVSATLTPINNSAMLKVEKSEISKTPQLIIDDVILSANDDENRVIVPLAQEEEQSFNSIELPGQEDQVKKVPILSNHTDEEESSFATNIISFNKLLNQIAHLNLIEHHFVFECDLNEAANVHEVKLTGSFNNWSQQLYMSRDTVEPNKWSKSLHLAPGEYEYKFVVNENDWRCNIHEPMRGINNFLSLVKL